jgi:hypothetical protein
MIIGTLRPTRRALALLTLAFGALAPTADTGCAMTAVGSASAVTTAAHEEHGHAHHVGGSGGAASSEDDSGDHPGSAPTCMRVTGCGAGGLVSPFRSRPAPPAPALSAANLPTPDHYQTVFPGHEPPPPRLLV